MNEGISEKKEFVKDLINALAIYKAKEAGAFGRVNLQTEEAGVLGGMMTDVQNASLQYTSREISKEDAIQEVKLALSVAAETILRIIANVVVEPIAIFIKTRIPVLSKVVDTAKEYVKNLFVEKIKKAGARIFKFVKEKIFS